MRAPIAIALVGVVLVMASCTPDDGADQPVTSPPRYAEGYEIVADQPFLPKKLGTQAVLVSDPGQMSAVWDHYQLGGAPESFQRDREVALFVGAAESGSCPIEIEDVSVEGSNVTITTADSEGPCTLDAVPRTFVFLFRSGEAPAADGVVTIQDFELEIRPARSVVSRTSRS